LANHKLLFLYHNLLYSGLKACKKRDIILLSQQFMKRGYVMHNTAPENIDFNRTPCFWIYDSPEYKEYSISNVFLEKEVVPKRVKGYGGIEGAYSLGGIRTYKISSPTYAPDENALLAFDVWTDRDGEMLVSVELADVDREAERYTYAFEVKGGGKWKRIICKAGDLKGETSGMPLKGFTEGRALVFDSADDAVQFAVTNILWL
jgi:hypothetical protein